MYCCCSVTKLCLTLCDPVDCSTPGLPLPHHLLEFAQVHVHGISDAIQLSHPPPPSSPFAFHLSQHQGLFQWVSCIVLNVYYIPRQRVQEFSLLCVFILFLYGPWCLLRSSVQWNQTNWTRAVYSAVFPDLSHPIWGWSRHTYLACLWGSQQFSQPCGHQWFQILQCNHASPSQLETRQRLWSTPWCLPLF